MVLSIFLSWLTIPFHSYSREICTAFIEISAVLHMIASHIQTFSFNTYAHTKAIYLNAFFSIFSTFEKQSSKQHVATDTNNEKTQTPSKRPSWKKLGNNIAIYKLFIQKMSVFNTMRLRHDSNVSCCFDIFNSWNRRWSICLCDVKYQET